MLPDVGSPDDPAWLRSLVSRSPLLDRRLRGHWLRVLPWLTSAERYELAATLRSTEQAAGVLMPGPHPATA